MAAIDIYAPDNIIANAQQSSGDWWQKTLQNAKQQYSMEQQAYNDSFDRAKKWELFPSEVDAARNQNKYNALRYEDGGRMLENGMSDANLQARFDKQNYDYQMPAAMLHGRDIMGDAPNKMEGMRNAYEYASQNYGDTPGIRGLYGNQLQGMTTASNLDSAIALGDADGMNRALMSSGIKDLQVSKDPVSGGYVVHTPNGITQPMSAEQARNLIATRMGGVAPTPFSTAGAAMAKENRTYQYKDALDVKDEQLALREVGQYNKMLADKDVLAKPEMVAYYTKLRDAAVGRLNGIRAGNNQPYTLGSSAPISSPSMAQTVKVSSGLDKGNSSTSAAPAASAATASRTPVEQPAYVAPPQASVASPAVAPAVNRPRTYDEIKSEFKGWVAKPAGNDYVVIDPNGNRMFGSQFQQTYGVLPATLSSK